MRNFLLFSFWVVFTPCAFTATDDGIDPSLFNEIDIDPSLFNEISNTNGKIYAVWDDLDALLANQERREIPEISIAQQSLVKTNDDYLSKRRKFSENSSEKKTPRVSDDCDLERKEANKEAARKHRRAKKEEAEAQKERLKNILERNTLLTKTLAELTPQLKAIKDLIRELLAQEK